MKTISAFYYHMRKIKKEKITRYLNAMFFYDELINF